MQQQRIMLSGITLSGLLGMVFVNLTVTVYCGVTIGLMELRLGTLKKPVIV